MSINIKFDQTKKAEYLKPTNRYTVWRVFGLLILGSLIACVMFVFYFVYQYSYLTLSNSNAILIINSNLGVDVIDSKSFIISQEIINSKKNLPEINTSLRNIFYYVQNTTTTATTTKQK